MSTINKQFRNDILIELTILIIVATILCDPKLYSIVALDGIMLWATLLLPTLFPFLVFSRMLQDFNITAYISKKLERVTAKLFHCSGESAYVFLVGIMSGYPIGSKITADLYLDGKISAGEAKRMASFSSNSGPMFIIGTVGIGMLGSFKIGLILLVSHVLGAIINGLIFRNYKLNQNEKLKTNYNEKETNSFASSISSSVVAVLNIGAYICLFFIISNVCANLHLFSPIVKLFEIVGVVPAQTTAFLSGILEITKGCNDLGAISALSPLVKTTAICFILTFGGISTTMQAFHFLKKTGLKYNSFVIMKLSHALISTIICLLLCLILL